MTSKTKIILAFGFLGLLGLGATFTKAQINVRSDLGNAIQNIQKVYFSPNGVRDPDPSKNILVEMSNGVVRIHGKVLVSPQGKNNTMSATASGAILLLGKGNTIDGDQNIIIGGTNNRIREQAINGGIFGGSENKIHKGTSNYIFGGFDNKIQGSNSIILGGKRNIVLSGKNNYLLAGSDKTVRGKNIIAGGKNIKFTEDRNNVFVWSDNKKRNLPEKKDFEPTTDNVFLVRAANGIGINTANPQVHGVDIANGTLQIGDQPGLACNATTNGAMKFKKGETAEKPGCFCYCNGLQWTAMTPSNTCSEYCKGTNLIQDEKCFSYTVYKNKITITKFSNNTDPECQGTDLKIPAQIGGKNVIAIAANAFKNKGLTSVRIPSTIADISNNAFANNNISSLIFDSDGGEASSINIGNEAFDYNNIQGTITFPKKLWTIGANAFSNNKITEVYLGTKIKTIGQYAFSNNGGKVKGYINQNPNSITVLGDANIELIQQ